MLSLPMEKWRREVSKDHWMMISWLTSWTRYIQIFIKPNEIIWDAYFFFLHINVWLNDFFLLQKRIVNRFEASCLGKGSEAVVMEGSLMHTMLWTKPWHISPLTKSLWLESSIASLRYRCLISWFVYNIEMLQARAKKVGVTPTMVLPSVLATVANTMNHAEVAVCEWPNLIVVTYSLSWLKGGT